MFVNITVTKKNVKTFPIHEHKTWEYICYEEGSGSLKTEAGDIFFEPGTVIVVPPNFKHGSSAKTQFRNLCIHTDLAMIDNQRIYLPLASKEIRRLFSVIGGLYREKEKYTSIIDTLLIALKDLILQEATLAIETPSLSIVHNAIMKNFMDCEFDLAEVIKQSGYVDDVLRLKFKAAYGVTPKEYLDNLRMGLAKDYLRIYGKILPIKAIAEMCGFNDPLYFSRKVKRKFGCTPKEYIKKKSR